MRTASLATKGNMGGASTSTDIKLRKDTGKELYDCVSKNGLPDYGAFVDGDEAAMFIGQKASRCRQIIAVSFDGTVLKIDIVLVVTIDWSHGRPR